MTQFSEQEIAIYTHDKNLIVMAGAGSGKTYVLVNRYLALLDRNRDWPLNGLVAITFTRKAAQEMRDRVRQELEKRLHTSLDVNERDIWAGRIASMESARINTIHGLCTDILRANAAEAEIDPRFVVLDEVEAGRLLEDVIDDVLRVIVAERDPALRLFTEYDAHTIRGGLIRLIGADWGDLPDDPYAEWEQRAGEYLAGMIQNETYRWAADWLPGDGWPDEDDKLLDVWRDCWDSLVLLDEQTDLFACLDALKTLRRVIKVNVGAAARWGGKDTLEEAKDALKILREAATTALDEIGDPAIERKAADLLPLWERLIRRAQVAYRVAKDKERLLDFDDLERLTRDLLYRHPAVGARYRQNEFRHILVDEFQDTNAAQWDIVRALADPSQPGCLFVVGDVKQSIYQFRGADVSVFEQVRGMIIGAGGVDVALVRSFRTHQPLVDGFNHLFTSILAKDLSNPAADYEVELGQLMTAFREQSPTDQPSLELLLIDKGMVEGEDKAEQCRRWEAYEIASRLRQIVEVERRPVYDKYTGTHRPIGYGDVALLFQSMSNVNVYEDVFKLAGLPFVTMAGRGYYNRQEVWDLLNLLTALHNPADDLRLAAALRSPLFNLSDDALLALRLLRDENNKRLSLWKALDKPVGVPDDELPLVEFARVCLYELHGLAGRVTISELLREALGRTGYLATLTSLPDGARRRGNVEKLLDKARASGQVTLGAFSQYLRDLSAREVREGEALVDVSDAVTLMTVHASKGLEYPMVVLVDSSWERGFRGSPVVMSSAKYGLTCKLYDGEQDKIVGSYAHKQAEKLQSLREDAERKRLLYVAATRAADYLLVSGQIGYSQKNGWKADGWLGLIWEALPLHDFVPEAGFQIVDHHACGKISVIVPGHPPDDELIQSAASRTGWDQPEVQRGQPFAGATEKPTLLNSIRLEPATIARHLSATQMADLGSVDYDRLYRDRFRRSILHAAPTPVKDVGSRKQTTAFSPQIIGNMVHDALRWWRFPTQEYDLESILKSYAWKYGVIDQEQEKLAVKKAHELLVQTMNSDAYRWIQEAEAKGRRVYRELPFVFKNDQRVIHGVLDVLFQWGESSWAIVDYKTSYVPDYEVGYLQPLREHAKRYHLQTGVYAAAVREQLDGITPDVYIHYIRYAETIQVYAGEWELALGKIEHMIGNVLDESDWV